MIPRMRTIEMLYKEIHKIDKESQISKNFIRNLIITGKVKSVKAGCKYLVNLDEVLNYLSNPIQEVESDSVAQNGKLRKVD